MNREKIKNCFTKYWFLISLVLFVLFVFSVVWLVFSHLCLSFDDLRNETDSKGKLIERAFTIIGGIVGGAIAVFGLFALIWRSILMGKQTEIAQEQLKISQNIRYAEQFEKSVKNLENEDLGTFKVGLVSLNALSQEGEKEYRQVWEQLCYFLSNHKPLKEEGEKPHPKVEAIAEMLRERNTGYEDKEFRLDLSYAHLEGATLKRANLYGVSLMGANLEKANLMGANLEKASLVVANLEKTNLIGVKIGVNLDGANLVGAELGGALFGGKTKSDEAQDLTNLTPENLRGTYYDIAGLEPNLPDGISKEQKPKPISYSEWLKLRRPERKN